MINFFKCFISGHVNPYKLQPDVIRSVLIELEG